ncbi:MAG: L-fucose mutarotase [Microbacteriaceae bacterium]|jgi:L-fucose mutarotase|nr:L-fucose mutarotase [Microbacteriaceae bacterium]
MLTGIDPLLSGELLLALDQMGHGDSLVIADANFPARRLGTGHVVSLAGASAPAVARAIFTVFPVDPVEPISLMQSTADRLPVQDELVATVPSHLVENARQVGRHEFYELAREAAVIVQSGDSRPYANLIVHKAGINR